MARRVARLETISIELPESALEVYEAALSSLCASVGFFRDDKTGTWRVEGVKPVGNSEPEMVAALALAAAATGVTVPVLRTPTPAEGWLERTHASFPELHIGRRFVVRGTHLRSRSTPGRITLTLNAGLAFGSGEHGSTRGCLRAIERLVWRRPRRILDLGTGSGILAMAAASLLHRNVLATDIEPRALQVAQSNAVRNHLGRLVRFRLADGWQYRSIRAASPYDLVLANILARPLCLMARQAATHLAPRGALVLSGLLRAQARDVLIAHRRCGLRLESSLQEGPWTTLILRRPAGQERGALRDLVPPARMICDKGRIKHT